MRMAPKPLSLKGMFAGMARPTLAQELGLHSSGSGKPLEKHPSRNGASNVSFGRAVKNRDNARQRHWLARFRRRSIVVSKTRRMVDVSLALFASFAGNSSTGFYLLLMPQHRFQGWRYRPIDDCCRGWKIKIGR